MDEKFSREAFEEGEAASLADALSEQLTVRLRTSASPVYEVERIVTELRALGHDLWNYDRSNESAFWGGDYVARPRGHRMVLAFWYPELGSAFVDVGFGRWPEV
jgi:hypothetical protein